MLSRCRARPTCLMRSLHTTSPRKRDLFDPSSVDRPTDDVDVCIVGASPAGLSAAICLKQLKQQNGREIRVVILEKGAEIRALASKYSPCIPQSPQMAKTGTYVVSLSRITAWLGSIAKKLGAGLVYSEDGRSILGVRTDEDTFEPGMEFHARVTLLAKSAHGSLSKEAIRRFKLRDGRDPQTYRLRLKEVRRVNPAKHEPGKRIKHHPYFRNLLSGDTTRIAYGARVLNEGGLQSVPKLNFPGGALIGCSAGFVNVVKIKGTYNTMKSDMLAAEAAFGAIASQTSDAPSPDDPADMSAYDTAFHESWVHSDLHEVRNVRPSLNTPLGVLDGVVYSGIDTLLLRGRTPWTFRNTSGRSDAAHTRRASECTPIAYPPFEPPLSTDILTSVALTGTNHAEDQPMHLHRWVEDAVVRWVRVHVNVEEYVGPLGLGCPAQVYEYVDAEDAGPKEGKEGEIEVEKVGWGGKRLVINSQNCINCKFCDVKVPTQDITWTVLEGSGGPKYSECFAEFYGSGHV
ncbi:hypothetical protein C8Q79DRAFT_1002101 [Trametes meyenii]|nr:hypothetical protein C8Q79DRAFT_1002101 [Trametes meyenii]